MRTKKHAGQAPPHSYSRKFIAQRVKEITKEIKFYDNIMKALLIASGIQLTVAFSFINGFWGSIFPVSAAIAKAVGIEAATWVFNRAVSRARELHLPQWFLWVLLTTVMAISTRANLNYEHQKRLERNPRAVYMQATAPTTANVNEYLDTSDKIDSWLAGGIIPFLILGISFARSLQIASAQHFETAEVRKAAKIERDRRYRERKRKELKRVAPPGGGK